VGKSINGAVTQFLYDGFNPVQELAAGNPPASVTANLLTGLNIDEYFARSDSGGAMNFLTDALGSTIALTDSSGAVNTSYAYDPFGNVAIGGSSANPYQFTGRENDGTGLYYYRARYYSPRFQRFVSQDPISFRLRELNLYAYVANAPVRELLPKVVDLMRA
jgi:RHS repeat-associated protein